VQEFLISRGHDRQADTTAADFLYSPAVDNLGVSINTEGQCPLHLAAVYSNPAVVEILCINFPKTIHREDKDGATPLHLASAAHVMPEMAHLRSPKSNYRQPEDTRLLETLIAHGADVNAKDGQGNTCLHNATAWGNLKAVRVLIQSGADALCQNGAGWTPEYYSITVQAEVYFRNLVAEWEKRKAEEGSRQSDRRGRGGGAVRLVSEDDGEDLESEGSRSRADSARSQATSKSEGGLGIGVGSVDAWK
jgi:uncharacterized protein